MKLVKSRLPSFLFGIALSLVFISIFLKERSKAREEAGLNKKHEFELALQVAPSVRAVSFILPVLEGKQSFFHRERPNRLVLFYSPVAVGTVSAKDKFNLVKEFSVEEFAANNFLLTSEREKKADPGGVGANHPEAVAVVNYKYLIQGELTYCIDPEGNMCVYKKVSLTLDVSGVGASGSAASLADAKKSVIKVALPEK